MFNVKKKLDELINECKITAVGSGYTELICPIDNIEKFINEEQDLYCQNGMIL